MTGQQADDCDLATVLHIDSLDLNAWETGIYVVCGTKISGRNWVAIVLEAVDGLTGIAHCVSQNMYLAETTARKRAADNLLIARGKRLLAMVRRGDAA